MIAYVLGIVAVVLATASLSLTVVITRRIGSRDPVAVPRMWRRILRIQPLASAAGSFQTPRDGHEKIAFIANPTKSGVEELREQALRACSIRYLPQPLWFYTTADDPGTGQARAALEAGADVVVAVGGDGTVRAVAQTMADSDKPMGIIPMGTGNLFARNLDLPLGDTQAILRTVLEGAERRADVGWMDVHRGHNGHGEDERHLFLVIAGAGFDAEMVAGADDNLKKRLGWFAYFFAAIRHLGEKRMKAWVSVDGGDEIVGHMRTVLMANIGKLPGGIQLIPDATMDDGKIDIATIDARGGLVGWTELFGQVMAQGAGLKDTRLIRVLKTSRIDHVRGTEFDIRMEQPQKVQVDGESLGKATGIHAFVQPAALTLRVPQGSVPERTDDTEQPEATAPAPEPAEDPQPA
ncbi:diacylglycerol/lipid kinase family protein [Demequina zhanjiangensis]|uniref:Diacylglycerol kinase family protein n=1 Tax=Demequina zhanjiangensis TaxID=3051659 RepID=A0ABT8G006_9MICO|nr:diacylglycerol kinase family protein [Demequina sp. SYSU T00b26]MDN4472284.1 diacylglycerol kinase family protein [Demequina sp. SYSU T00b26]